MYLVREENFKDIFYACRAWLLDAKVENIKGTKTKEILNACVCLTNPRSRFIYHPKRKFNVAFNIAEMLSHISGINSTSYFGFWNSNYTQFSDNGLNFYGNYGERLKNYFPALVTKLKNNSQTRQAVLNIYCSNDMLTNTKDVPCTLALDFKIRKNKLNLTTFMRSNDLIWGLMYDLPAFTMIQEIVANSVGAELGVYTHFATSLHVYERHWELLKNMTDAKIVEMPRITDNYLDVLVSAKEAEKMTNNRYYFSERIDDILLSALIYYKMKKLKFDAGQISFPAYVTKLYN
jgi:thymidylate synthase